MPRFAALDTKLLLALAGGESDAEATIDYLQKNGFVPIITESVMEQLGELTESNEPLTRAAAAYASRWWPTWGIVETQNPNVNNGAAQVHAEKLIDQGLIPGASQLEAEILVEASCHNCELLVTFSTPLLSAESTPLNLALIESDLNKVTITIASPKVIANETVNDPTITRCMNFAQRWGFDALCMTNLFAFRATDPRQMKACPKPVGDQNDRWLAACAREAGVIVAAWGVHGTFMARDEEVLKLLDDVRCLKTTRDGHPYHPLYVRGDEPLKPFSIKACA